MTLDTSNNTSFSLALPGLQLAVDSTSLGEFKLCPRKYFYTIICGWQPRSESVHLTFGILYHSTLEHYDNAKAQGNSHQDALDSSVDFALRATWNKALKRPWVSDGKNKNRYTLLRSVIWYLDKFGESDSLETLIIGGKPAVELSFRFDLGVEASSTGESFAACGHLDRMVRFNDSAYILDRKTTEHTIDTSFFLKFSPDNQMSMYDLAGQVAFQTPVEGIIIDGVQVAVTFSRYQRGIVPRTQEGRTEWLSGAAKWLAEMEKCAIESDWPMNDKNCHHFGGCPFRPVCSRPPSAREQWLKTDYSKRIWDPLQRRGDI